MRTYVTGRKIKFLQTDNGKEYVNDKFSEFLLCYGIQRRLSAACTPQQNGTAERVNRTWVLDMGRCLLLQGRLKAYFWAETIYTASYLRSRWADKRPYKKIFQRKPKLGHLRVLGCVVQAKMNHHRGSNFNPRARKMIFVGYSTGVKG